MQAQAESRLVISYQFGSKHLQFPVYFNLFTGLSTTDCPNKIFINNKPLDGRSAPPKIFTVTTQEQAHVCALNGIRTLEPSGHLIKTRHTLVCSPVSATGVRLPYTPVGTIYEILFRASVGRFISRNTSGTHSR